MIAFFRVLFCAAWSIFWISLSIVFYLFTFRSAIPVAMARTCWAPGILWACNISLEIKGTDRLDRSKYYVYVSNHQSFLDIPILFRAIPQNLYFVAKKELRRIPFIGWYVMVTGMIFIDRSSGKKSVESLKRAATLISRGKSVLMFPEGTRSNNANIASFKKGPFILARQAQVPVVPVGIKGEGRSFTINKLRKTHIQVTIGVPVPCEEDPVNKVIEDVREKVGELAAKPVAELV